MHFNKVGLVVSITYIIFWFLMFLSDYFVYNSGGGFISLKGLLTSIATGPLAFIKEGSLYLYVFFLIINTIIFYFLGVWLSKWFTPHYLLASLLSLIIIIIYLGSPFVFMIIDKIQRTKKYDTYQKGFQAPAEEFVRDLLIKQREEDPRGYSGYQYGDQFFIYKVGEDVLENGKYVVPITLRQYDGKFQKKITVWVDSQSKEISDYKESSLEKIN